MKLAPLVALALLALGAGAGEDADAPAGAPEVRHFLITAGERVIGVAVEETGEGTWKGKRSLRCVTRETYRFAVPGRPAAAATTVERTQHLAPGTGEARSVEETEETAGRRVTYSAEIEPGAVVFRQRLAGGRVRTKRVELDKGAYAELDGRALAAKGLLRPVGELEAFVLAPRGMGLARQRARVMGRKVYEGKPSYLLRVEDANEPTAGWDLRCDEAGRTVELFAGAAGATGAIGAIGRRLVPKEKAVLPREPARLAARSLVFNQSLRRPDALERLTLEIRVAGDVAGRLLPAAPYQEVAFEPGVYRVTLRALRPDGTLPREALSEEARARYLAPALRVESDAPEIQKLAREIVAPEASRLAQVYRLARWVHRRIGKAPLLQSEGSALECLRARKGDCTEHAALFIALARAEGVPAREAYGLVAGEEGLALHAWAEAHVDGRWIPVDAALGRFGFPALYLLLGHGERRGAAEAALARLYGVPAVRVLATDP